MLVVPKGWGHELWIVNTDKYCGKQLTVLPTKWCSVHTHLKKTETFYILKGSMFLQYTSPNLYNTLNEIKNNKSKQELIEYWESICNNIVLFEGDSFDVELLSYHRFTSNTNHPCTFIEFSTHHSDEDSYRIIKGD